MPYQIAQTELNALGASLAQYYETAWQEGVKGLFDNMARAKMGIVTGYLDQAKDTYANLRKASNDKFRATFTPTLKHYFSVYLANRNDVASVLVTVAETALKQLANKIPIPLLGTVVSAVVVPLAADKGREELHKRSVAEADQQLATKTGTAPTKFFTTDTEDVAFIQKSIDQYKLICKYIQTLPTSISSYDDAVTFPGATFRVKEAASHLNVALVSVQQYLSGMQERLEKVQSVSKEYIDRVHRDMPAAVGKVLDTAYEEAYRKGRQDSLGNRHPKLPRPIFQMPVETGGATQLAAYVAHATALGYYEGGPEVESGREIEMTTFPRQPAIRVTGPPNPQPPTPQRSAVPLRGNLIDTPLGSFPRRK